MNPVAAEPVGHITPLETPLRQTWPRPHGKMALPGILRFVSLFILELIGNLPGFLKLAVAGRILGTRRRGEPMIACVGDNLDEVNGIAISSRIMLKKLRDRGHNAYLFGVAFHSKEPRTEGPGGVILVPGRYSLDQAGYPHSEVTLIRLKHFIRFLQDHPVNVVEFQTPGPVSFLCLLAAKAAGVATISHYRTDILTYSKMLVTNRAGVWAINTWTRLFTLWSGPVIVPSQAYAEKVSEMGVSSKRIFKLPRGVDFDDFHPDHADPQTWRELGLPATGVKLLYVGRISKEKNLDILADAMPELLAGNPELSLTLVGEGPYRKGLQERFGDMPRVHFTGVLQGRKLAAIFAGADIMVFPSLTDTFGNSVVEALASGIPCITSNQGGPQEIIEDGRCGLIFDHRVPGDLTVKISALVSDPTRLADFKSAARQRALFFTYDRAAQAFWSFYARALRENL